MVHTTGSGSPKIGFNFQGLTSGTGYTAYLGFYNSWSSRTITIRSSTDAVTGALGSPPYNSSTGTSRGTVAANTTSKVISFDETATESGQLRIGLFINNNQPMASFVMLEEKTIPEALTATLVKPADGVVSYSAPFATATTSSVNSGDRIFFNIGLEPGYDLLGAEATGGAAAEVVGNQIIVSGITENTTITLNVKASVSAAINTFAFPTVEDAVATIDQTERAISVTVPFGTDITTLTPSIRYIGARYEPTGAQNFSTPVKYTVYPNSPSDEALEYTVAVTIAPASGEKDILAFSYGGSTGLISGNAITVYVLKDTSLSGIPIVTVSKYATYTPAGAQSFTEGEPVTYTVKAQDGTTKNYAVTVNILPNAELNKAIYVENAQKAYVIATLPPVISIDDGSGTMVAGAAIWDTSGIPDQSYAYDTIEVKGTVTAAGMTQSVSSFIEVVPRGLVYFIDSNSQVAVADRKDAGSQAFDSVSALLAASGEPALLNGISDKARSDAPDTWGYTGTVGTSGATLRSTINENLDWYHVENYTDKYNTGWFSASAANTVAMEYSLELPAGDYMVTTGIQEYWPSGSTVHTRPYTINVTSDSVTLATLANTLETPSGQPYGNRQSDTLYFSIATDAAVTVSLAKTPGASGEEPQLSWLAVAKQGVYAKVLSTDETAGLKTTTLVENYTPEAISGNGILSVTGENKLVSVDSSAIVNFEPFSSTSKGVLSLLNNIDAVPAGYEAKLFIWDADSAPLVKAVKVK
jgi:hypothetical protein